MKKSLLFIYFSFLFACGIIIGALPDSPPKVAILQKLAEGKNRSGQNTTAKKEDPEEWIAMKLNGYHFGKNEKNQETLVPRVEHELITISSTTPAH